VKGDSHHRVADGLKYGRCNYECKNLHDAEMFSRVFRVDNLFRFDCKTGTYVWPSDVEKKSTSYGDTNQALNSAAKENVNEKRIAQDAQDSHSR